MTVRFEISELEKVVEPDNLLDVLDSLLAIGKLSEYYWDWQCGEVELEIPERVAVEELFSDFTKGKLSS